MHVRRKRSKGQNKTIALLTNNDDDVYCFRKELLEEINKAGYELIVSCPYGPKFELLNDMLFLYDDPQIDRRGTSIYSDLKLFFHYLRLLGEYSPDMILTYTAKPNVYGGLAAFLQGIPVISNVTGLGSVIKMQGLKKQAIMALFRFVYRKSYCIMFQNETNMKLAQRLRWIRGEYKLIPGSGVNTTRYPLQPYPEGGDGISGKTVVFNYFGRILHDKGVDDYIEAAKRIKAKYPNTEFNILGFIEPTEDHYTRDLKNLQEEGIVIYRGNQKDVKPFIARAHAIIHPSTYGEGMSNVLLENASSGRPVITTDNPGCRETVDDTVSGFVYHGGNVDELVEKIELFLKMNNADRQQMGVCGRKKVQKSFERSIVVKAYLDVIKERVK